MPDPTPSTTPPSTPSSIPIVPASIQEVGNLVDALSKRRVRHITVTLEVYEDVIYPDLDSPCPTYRSEPLPRVTAIIHNGTTYGFQDYTPEGRLMDLRNKTLPTQVQQNPLDTLMVFHDICCDIYADAQKAREVENLLLNMARNGNRATRNEVGQAVMNRAYDLGFITLPQDNMLQLTPQGVVRALELIIAQLN
jgi:hypothetical protein